ncbi:MAG: hypothetical protein IPL31_16805 [Saprospiraceae bacterium]|nr:hypothetical protein [Saprospiraceae bacterium]
MAYDIRQIKEAEMRSLKWLLSSYLKHGTGGFPHSRWNYLPACIAWTKDYPETTGYLIENLLSKQTLEKTQTKKIAEASGDWLLAIQNPEGYFCSGVKFKKPSVFNTAQILFGFHELYLLTKEEKYLNGLKKAFNWILKNINPAGILTAGLYVEGYYAAYYSRALWPLILADKQYFKTENIISLTNSMDSLFSNKNEFHFFNNCGFSKSQSAISHTVAYALEGFYESSTLLNNKGIQSYIIEILEIISNQILKYKKTPGSYYNNLTGDYSFVCVTGEAQFCALLLKVYHQTEILKLKEAAKILFGNLLKYQIHSASPEHHGAFPSSVPIWKSYFPFRYTNWTNKFFLDACFEMKKLNA